MDTPLLFQVLAAFAVALLISHEIARRPVRV